jgi:hypothetical protein
LFIYSFVGPRRGGVELSYFLGLCTL